MNKIEAIKELEELGNNLIDDFTFAKNSYFEALDLAINALEGRPTGEWIPHTMDRWVYAKCSCCEYIADTKTNYCPNCGAKMKGEEE